jgi:hypothetical protein
MRKLLGAVLVAALVASTFTVSTVLAAPALAANAAQFDPGNIISDATMYNGSALTADQVQSFLAQREGACSSTCMANYRQNTPTMAANTRCAAYSGSASERASDIITRVGQACNISQKSLIVLIEKEQSLISAVNPTLSRYNYATGFGCPDTAPCDPAVGGFFYQVYYAAKQFQTYRQTPTQWNYQAGRVNQVLFHPDAARCGAAPVFIQNRATAGLYIYTPYQPNAAAMRNLYGSGDSCSSYGNRNFWRIFTDWFGSPTAASSLVRTINDATVYLVSDANKYPVPSLSILTALSPLGQVGYVSQQFLDSFVTSHVVGRSLRGPDGSIYFYDSGIKLPFTSCGQAADYGASCDVSGYVQLNQAQVDTFATGPVLSNVLGTVEGSRYYIKGGAKAEILDDASQAAAGIPAGMNVLTENAVAALPLAAPVVADGSYALTRGTGSYSLIAGGSRFAVAADSVVNIGVPSRTAGSLYASSLALIPASPTVFSGITPAAAAGSVTLLTSTGRYTLSAGGLSATTPTVAVPQRILDMYAVGGTIGAGSFIKTPDNGTVYIVMPTDIRPVSSWDALLALSPTGAPVISTVSPAVLSVLKQGPVALTAGTLVRSPDNATVYFINGVTNRIALASFDFPVDAGFNSLVFSTNDRIQAYPLATDLMSFGFGCGTDNYIAGGGSLHAVSPAIAGLYPFVYVPMDQFTCGQMKKGAAATPFIRTSDGSIYQISGGKKLPIVSMTRYAQLSAGQGWTDVSVRFATQYPTGPLA